MRERNVKNIITQFSKNEYCWVIFWVFVCWPNQKQYSTRHFNWNAFQVVGESEKSNERIEKNSFDNLTVWGTCTTCVQSFDVLILFFVEISFCFRFVFAFSLYQSTKWYYTYAIDKKEFNTVKNSIKSIWLWIGNVRGSDFDRTTSGRDVISYAAKVRVSAATILSVLMSFLVAEIDICPNFFLSFSKFH